MARINPAAGEGEGRRGGMFGHFDDVRGAVGWGALAAAPIALLYGLSADKVQVIDYAVANAIKVVMNRRVTAGDPGDRDVYGAQQHAPMLELEI